jgi:hypothetical protein
MSAGNLQRQKVRLEESFKLDLERVKRGQADELRQLEFRLKKEYSEMYRQREAEITQKLTGEFRNWETKFFGDHQKGQDTFQKELGEQ